MNSAKVLKKNNELEILFDEPNTTFLDPLVTYILKYNDDAYASYSVEHPLTGPARIRIRSKNKQPEALLFDAMDKILSDLECLINELKKE